jgi:hypothetical protein
VLVMPAPAANGGEFGPPRFERVRCRSASPVVKLPTALAACSDKMG